MADLLIARTVSPPRNLMKTALLLVTILVLTVVPALAQERSRLFDNFDTARGVQIHRPDFVPIAAKAKAVATKLTTNAKKFFKKTAQVTRVFVTDGLASREAPVAEKSRLMMGTSLHMKGFTTGDPVVDSYIVDSSRRYAIDPLLIYAQMHQESSFKLRATSYKGASGLMQLMPATARRLGVSNIYDPRQNIEGGVKYMRMLLDMFGGDVNLALAGYNAGEGAVMKYGYQIPPYNETREYVRRISARYGAISNPSIARMGLKVTSTKAAQLAQKESRPLNVYEPNALAIRLADGRMRLVNQ
ncbi:MAG: lytic transglycosylase domain-containing protein [Pyrinomonadaceae bacterium]